ncbi:MAG: divergent polysaccharide deacetylase family protein [Alphaproteobacteria bacterium]
MARKRSKKGPVFVGRPRLNWRRGLPVVAGVVALALVGLWIALGTGWGQRHATLSHAPAKPAPSHQAPSQEAASHQAAPKSASRDGAKPEHEKPEAGSQESAARPPGPQASLHPPAKAAPPRVRPQDSAHPALWRANAAHVEAPPGRPMIAIVIDDVGVDRRRSERALALPAPLTMAFLPYARDLPHLAAEARSRGHELLVHVPMEPLGGDKDAGPEPLRDALSAEEMRRRLDWMLARFDSYVGINNHMGSRLTQDPRAMRIVLEDLRERGLLFLDSRTTAETVGAKLGRELGLPVVERDVFLDNDERADRVREKLKETERVAEKKGHAIAIGHPHDGTIEALGAWLPDAQARGFVLVPVSAIALEEERHAKAKGENGATP